jgi:hypothetical protein
MNIQQKTSNLVTEWIRDGFYTKIEFSSFLGFSRPTLDSRLKKNNWSKTEIDIVKTKCPF